MEWLLWLLLLILWLALETFSWRKEIAKAVDEECGAGKPKRKENNL